MVSDDDEARAARLAADSNLKEALRGAGEMMDGYTGYTGSMIERADLLAEIERLRTERDEYKQAAEVEASEKRRAFEEIEYLRFALDNLVRIRRGEGGTKKIDTETGLPL